MNNSDLRKEFDTMWKKEHQSQYTMWLVLYFGSLVPLLIGLIPMLMEGPNDQTVGGAIIGFVVMLVMEGIALLINRDRAAAWKKYQETHQKRQ